MATIQSIKSKIQGLIDKSNEATGGSDTDLTTAIDSLIANQGASDIVLEKSVNFWDYDGTLLYSYTIAEAKALTELPPLPTYDDTRFSATGWTKTLEQVQALEGFCDICVNLAYKNTSYSNIALLVVEVTTAQIILYGYKRSGTNAYIDWGDGSSTTITSTTVTTHTHTYSAPGKYTILLYANNSAYLGGGTTGNATFISNPQILVSAYVKGYSTLQNTFYGCYRLKFVYSNMTSNYLFANCYNLRIAIGDFKSNYAFNECYNLERVHMSYPMGNNFTNTFSLKKLVFTGTDSIYSLPPNIKTLILTASSVMGHSATVPCTTVGTKIYVPDDLVETYKTATGWSSYADYIYPISEYVDE